jgi:RimJ/RimL family protein N-acetyltransferase
MRTNGKEFLCQVKSSAGSSRDSIRIPVGRPPRAYLRPVATSPGFIDARDVERLTKWRNGVTEKLLTRFDATPEKTSRWLIDSVGPDDGKILFFVEDEGGRAIGQMGLDFIDWERGRGEVDAVIRGEDAAPGLMTQALKLMLAWARDELGLSDFNVSVLADNTAREFYQKAGFREKTRIPLRVVVEKNGTRLVKDETLDEGECELIIMEYAPETIY